MAFLRDGLPPVPLRMAQLPIDKRGYPVPYFVEWIDGEPDFRRMDGKKLRNCITHNFCWLCGKPLARWKTFVLGPMCIVNRTTAEPPSHIECATFAVQACPFLRLPKSKRNESGLSGDRRVAGIMIPRNPGVAVLWTTHTYTMEAESDGILFRLLAEPSGVAWFAEGREATRAEVLASLESGLPLLEDLARGANEPVSEVHDLYQAALRFLPAEAVA